MDSTTDAGNVEDKLIVIMSFCKDNAAGEVGSFTRYFSIKEKLMLMVSLCASSKHYKLLELTMY